MDITQHIAQCFATRGDSEYGGENVTQLEHALQCAHLAEQAGASTELVVAALLHDIGHILHELPDDAPEQGIDDHHEHSGYRFLQKHFSSAVTEPVRQHVNAKRYLCTVDSEYQSKLSEPSLVSLRLQGGLMSPREQQDFTTCEHWQDSVSLRRWDDQAKVTDLQTPDLQHYLPMIEQTARPSAQTN
ncbi:MAG: phosphonate degradation HD-domain oxygenase [Aureliella sp.]